MRGLLDHFASNRAETSSHDPTSVPSVRILLLIAILLLLPREAFTQTSVCAGHLVTIGPDGATTRGSKDALRQAVHRGLAIRVGWSIDANGDGTPDLAHWADAGFLTDWQDEIFAQVSDMQRQTPRRDPPRVEMPATEQRWTGLLGTTGTLVGHFSDGSEAPSARVTTTWCAASCPAPEWRLVYRHDGDGKPLEGSKDALFDAVRRGHPIRFAWGASLAAAAGGAAVEHAAEPVFVTITSGAELFAQLPEHVAQASYVDPAKARFDNASVMWRGLMGTDGTFDAVYVDRASGREVQRIRQRAGIAWFVLTPDPACAQPPVTLAVTGGVRRTP
jgi:hypothetical protein